jgi:hypothetical protein
MMDDARQQRLRQLGYVLVESIEHVRSWDRVLHRGCVVKDGHRQTFCILQAPGDGVPWNVVKMDHNRIESRDWLEQMIVDRCVWFRPSRLNPL